MRSPTAPSSRWAWWLAVCVLKPMLLATTRRDWQGTDRIPADHGVILAVNHISHIDPVTISHVVLDSGRVPRFLAKASLFESRILGAWFRSAGHIPIDRAAVAGALEPATAALQAGDLVVVYVEGSITKDPNGWPMASKPGAARLALATGAPVIPVGQWGAQHLLPAYSARLNVWGRTKIQVKVGDPVDLSDLLGAAPTPQVVRAASERITAAIVALVEDLRGEQAPAERYKPAVHVKTRSEDQRGVIRR